MGVQRIGGILNPDFAPKQLSFNVATRKILCISAKCKGSSFTTATKQKGHPNGCPFCLAEKEGFEPSNCF